MDPTEQLDTSSLAKVRRQLADQRAGLRVFEDIRYFTRLTIESRFLQEHGGDSKTIGTNEADRKRAFDMEVLSDKKYQDALLEVRTVQGIIDRLEAEMNIYLDDRAERDLAMRERSLG